MANGQPQTYIDWATGYFAGSYKGNTISLGAVNEIYKGYPLTKEIVLSIVDVLEDWAQLKADLSEINYPYKF